MYDIYIYICICLLIYLFINHALGFFSRTLWLFQVARQADDTLEVQVPAHLQPGDAFEACGLGPSPWLGEVCVVKIPTVDGRNSFRTTLKPWETIDCWYLQGNHHSRVSWVVQDFVHPPSVPQYRPLKSKSASFGYRRMQYRKLSPVYIFSYCGLVGI